MVEIILIWRMVPLRSWIFGQEYQSLWSKMWYCKVLEANIQTESHPIDFPGPVQEAHHTSNLPQIPTFRSGSYKIITCGNYSVSMNLGRQIWAAIKRISCENQHWLTLGEGLPSWQRIQIPYDRRHFFGTWCSDRKPWKVGDLSTRLVLVPWISKPFI